MIKLASDADVRRLTTQTNVEELSIYEKAIQAAQDNYARVVGSTLVKAYPGVKWKVTIRVEKTGATAFIQVPKVSMDYGQIIRIPESVFELERKAIAAGGELLERFFIGRGIHAEADLNKLNKDIKGNVIGAEKGEYSHGPTRPTTGTATGIEVPRTGTWRDGAPLDKRTG